MKAGNPRRPTGFTLLEMVCALAILICLFGGVYGIANGALQLSRASNEALLRELRLNHLDAMLRAAFEELPGSTQFELETGDEGNRLTILTETGSAPFRWQSQAALADRVMLRLERDPAGENQRRLVIEPWRSAGGGRLESIGNLRLIGGLEAARWRLFNVRTDRWEENWSMQEGRPLFAELTYGLAEQPGERRMVFWIPPYASRAGSPPQAPGPNPNPNPNPPGR